MTGPIYLGWTWKQLGPGRWEGTSGVLQRLGTVLTNGTNPQDYHVLIFIMEIMKFTPIGSGILDAVNHVLDLVDISKVRWRYRITAAWTAYVIVCNRHGKWIYEKKWVSGRHAFDEEFGPDGGEVLSGIQESSDDVIKSAYDVAHEIHNFIHGEGR